MEVTKIADGLWRWTAPHPEWKPGEDWDEEVACFYYEGFEGICLIDPLVPPGQDEERFFTALDADVERLGLPVAVVLTTPSHERSSARVQERYGASVWVARSGAGRVACPNPHPFDLATPLPGGLEALEGDGVDEVLFWIPDERALVAGDLLIGTGGGVRLCPDSWLADDTARRALRASLRFALSLPIERILVGHGPAITAGGADALAAAIEAAGPGPA